ncbi:MAG: hypothetical protein ACLQEQ_03075 [Nitrososphaerales archaeon]
MSRPDHSTVATFTYRVGTVLVAVGLAVLLVSWMSMGTVGASSAQITSNTGSTLTRVPAGNFYEAYSTGIATPKGVIEFRAVASTGPLYVYVYRVSAGDLTPLILSQTFYYNGTVFYNGSLIEGIDSYNYSTGLGNISRLSAYVAASHTEVLGIYGALPGRVLDTLIYPQDVEPVMVLVVNPTAAAVNVTYWSQTITVQVGPASGFSWAALLLAAGSVLLVAGFTWKRQARLTGRNPLK